MTQYNNNGGNNNGGKNNAHYSCLAIGTIKGRLAADPVVEYDQKNSATKVTARVLVNKKDGGVDSWNIVEYKNDNAEFASANFRSLAEFLKKGRSVTVTGEIAQNSRNNNGSYTYFMQIKPIPGGIIMDGDSQGGGAAQGQNNYNQNQGAPQGQPQGNFGGQQPPQGNFGGQPQQPPQGNFGGQPQGNFGGQPQGNFGGQPQGNFSGQPQGNFGGQPPQGNFGAPVGTGAPGGAPGNFGR